MSSRSPLSFFFLLSISLFLLRSRLAYALRSPVKPPLPAPTVLAASATSASPHEATVTPRTVAVSETAALARSTAGAIGDQTQAQAQAQAQAHALNALKAENELLDDDVSVLNQLLADDMARVGVRLDRRRVPTRVRHTALSRSASSAAAGAKAGSDDDDDQDDDTKTSAETHNPTHPSPVSVKNTSASASSPILDTDGLIRLRLGPRGPDPEDRAAEDLEFRVDIDSERTRPGHSGGKRPAHSGLQRRPRALHKGPHLPRQYVHFGFTECSVTCGSGVQHRRYVCADLQGFAKNKKECAYLPEPPDWDEVRVCENPPCLLPQWVPIAQEPCHVKCGVYGTMKVASFCKWTNDTFAPGEACERTSPRPDNSTVKCQLDMERKPCICPTEIPLSCTLPRPGVFFCREPYGNECICITAYVDSLYVYGGEKEKRRRSCVHNFHRHPPKQECVCAGK